MFTPVRPAAAAISLAAAVAVLLALPPAAPVAARPADPLPPDLALVPADAVGFVSVRVPVVWKHDILKGLRETVAAAGPKAVAAFEKQFYPSLATVDRVTVVGRRPWVDRPPSIVGIITFTEPVDREKFRKLYAADAAEEKTGGKSIYTDPANDIALAFPDDKLVVVGDPAGVAAVVAGPAKADGPLAPAVKLAAGGRAVVAAFNARAVPDLPRDFPGLPADVKPLLAADQVVLTIDLATPDPVVEARAVYADEDAATAAAAGLKAAAGLARGALATARKQFEDTLSDGAGRGPRPLHEAGDAAAALAGIGGMNQLDALLDNLPVKRTGPALVATVTTPPGVTRILGYYSATLGMLLPAVKNVREAAARVTGQNNLKQIGLAMHNYESAYGRFPAAAICDKDGKPLLSWRVAILPYIEQNSLYQEFKLDEPWDSEHNKKLIPKMPKLYVCPRAPVGEGKTVYKVFVGKGAMFETEKSGPITSITDGTSNTIMAIEGGEAVTWTKPDDIPFDPAKPLPDLSLPTGIKRVSVVLGDGSVRVLDLNKVKEAVIKLLIQKDDGQVIPPEAFEP